MLNSLPSGINVIGYVSGGLGIGVATRNLIAALLKRGIDVHALDLDPGGGRHGADNQFQSISVGRADDLPRQNNLFVLPGRSIAAHARDLQGLMLREGYLNAAFAFWELPQFPEVERLVLESFDVIVSSSQFVHHALDFSVSGVRIVRGMQPVVIPESQPARARFGLPEKGVVFVFSFEPMSCQIRKNPFAVVDVFLRAVGDEYDAHLVIKMNNAHRNGQELRMVQELRRYVNSHPRISIVAETLSYPDLMSLFASCDVFVSLHRSEGFGLGMLEAMLLGKPVLATAWSGNMSFMLDTNSCLVGYRLVPTHGSIKEYQRPFIPKGTVWAEPNVTEAGAWMKRLLRDPGLRKIKGEAAHRDAQAYCAEAERCGFVDEIQAIAENMNMASMAERRHDLAERLARVQKMTNPELPANVAKAAWWKWRARLGRQMSRCFRAEKDVLHRIA